MVVITLTPFTPPPSPPFLGNKNTKGGDGVFKVITTVFII